MQTDSASITIDPEFRDLIPPMADDERQQLEANLLADGCREKLTVWSEQGILLDGHNRYEICTRLNLPFEVEEKSFASRDDAMIWIINNQFGRRNISDYDRAELALRLKPLIAAKAKENQVARKGSQAGSTSQISVKLVDTQKELARAAGVSHDTIAKVEKIKADASPELVAAVKSGKASINAAATIATAPKAEQKLIVAKSEKEILEAAKEIKAKRTQERYEERQAKIREAAEQKRQERQERAENAELGGPESTLLIGDCLEQFSKIDDCTARLVFADPPYNIGLSYGEGIDDAKPAAVYMAWVSEWIDECIRVLTEDGSLWVMIGDEYAAEYGVMLKSKGLILRNWIKWHETFGVNCTGKFNRSTRHIFYCVKDADNFVFNADHPAARQPSARATTYNDPRADPSGTKLRDDLWSIPRVTATNAERFSDGMTQLPEDLLEIVVNVASDAGDTVLDPFTGSGTTGVVALRNGRNFIGMELNKERAILTSDRLEMAR